MTSQSPREAFRHGSDCAVTFVRRADTNRAWNDVWYITANGETYKFHIIQMIHSNRPPVFGSFYKDGRQVWVFRDDPRVRKGFKGGSYTFVYQDKTYVLFENRFGVQHILLFTDFLRNPWSAIEVTDKLRQEILHAYATHGLSEPESMQVDPRHLAALQAAEACEKAAQERVAQTASFMQRRRAFPEMRIAPDEWHLRFFNHTLAYMAVSKQSE